MRREDRCKRRNEKSREEKGRQEKRKRLEENYIYHKKDNIILDKTRN